MLSRRGGSRRFSLIKPEEWSSGFVCAHFRIVQIPLFWYFKQTSKCVHVAIGDADEKPHHINAESITKRMTHCVFETTTEIRITSLASLNANISMENVIYMLTVCIDQSDFFVYPYPRHHNTPNLPPTKSKQSLCRFNRNLLSPKF